MDEDRQSTKRIYVDDRQRTLRLVLLATAGLLLVAGALIWVNGMKDRETAETIIAQSPRPVSTPVVEKPQATQPQGLPAARLPGVASTERTPPAQIKPIPAQVPPGATSQAQSGPERPLPASEALVTQATESLPSPLTTAQEVKPAAPAGKKVRQATPRLLAATEARSQAGREDPMSEAQGYMPFPRIEPRHGATPDKIAGIPPPPPAPPAKEPAFVPPPPPPAIVEAGGGSIPPAAESGLSIAELPPPPAKPSMVDKLKLVGIIGERAILAVSDPATRMEHKWPRTITLGKGEQFESLNVVEVNRDSVTIEEDGERLVKNIEPVR